MTYSVAPPHLLIIDDDAAFRRSISEAFESRGFRTTQAADGMAGLQVLQTELIHLVLLDLQMPRLSGLETMQRMQRHARRVPCILVSGALDPQVIAQAEAMSVYSVLEKPLRFHDASQAVVRALQEVYQWEPPPVG